MKKTTVEFTEEVVQVRPAGLTPENLLLAALLLKNPNASAEDMDLCMQGCIKRRTARPVGERDGDPDQ